MSEERKSPGIDLSTLRSLAYRIKPVVGTDNNSLFFVKESNLTEPVEEFEKVLKAENGSLTFLQESEFEGNCLADALLQIPEEIKEKASAFKVISENKVLWYAGMLPEVMYNQSFIILGQIFTPARTYRYSGPGLCHID